MDDLQSIEKDGAAELVALQQRVRQLETENVRLNSIYQSSNDAVLLSMCKII